MTEVQHTIQRALSLGIQELQKAGCGDARVSCEVLLSHVLEVPKTFLFQHPDQVLSSVQNQRWLSFLEDRKKGKPVAYLVGFREFYSMDFEVNSDVLIPRPETELLLEEVLKQLHQSSQSPQKVCDVGTGSGMIGICLKKFCPSVELKAVDVSLSALRVAEKNAQRWKVNIDFQQSDLLQQVQGPLDLIVANLPYISSSDWETLPVEVKDFEPRLALDGGQDGLSLIHRLIQEAHDKLKEKGLLCLEMGFGQTRNIVLSLEQNFFSIQNIRQDLSGIDRVIVSEKR